MSAYLERAIRGSRFVIRIYHTFFFFSTAFFNIKTRSRNFFVTRLFKSTDRKRIQWRERTRETAKDNVTYITLFTLFGSVNFLLRSFQHACYEIYLTKFYDFYTKNLFM